MGCFQDVFDEMFPVNWLDPYGRMPLNPGASVSIDIEMTEKDGIKRISAVKTPPRADNMSFGDALSMVLSITDEVSGPLCGSLQAADQGKRDGEKSSQKDQDIENNPKDSEEDKAPFAKDDADKEKD